MRRPGNFSSFWQLVEINFLWFVCLANVYDVDFMSCAHAMPRMVTFHLSFHNVTALKLFKAAPVIEVNTDKADLFIFAFA